MATELSINNVVTIQVANPPAGLANYQINNLAIFTNETPVNAPILGYGVYLSPSDVATDWGTGSEAYAQSLAIFNQTPNILNGNGQLIIYPVAASGSGSTLADAMSLARAEVFFGGALWCNFDPTDGEIEDAATFAQANRILLFTPQHLIAELQPGGIFATLSDGGFTYARMLLYTEGAEEARIMAAAYAGRAMSTNFSGSATTATMHLKDLTTIQPDGGITQAVLELCKTVGVDVYVNIAGLPKVFSTGGNEFYDNIYNITWLVFALEVAGFNAIATTSTKLPQTETGIAVLRGAYIDVLEQSVTNGFVAPGAWNSPERFGNPADLIRNVEEIGYYIYSQPVNQQPQTDRAARQAPVIQIAVKYAGAVHSSNVIVNVNA